MADQNVRAVDGTSMTQLALFRRADDILLVGPKASRHWGTSAVLIQDWENVGHMSVQHA